MQGIGRVQEQGVELYMGRERWGGLVAGQSGAGEGMGRGIKVEVARQGKA